ncbi:MAG TPA: hypothetical protein VGR78_09995 [Verrucomicrobiae bacterium]|nr:hypothetical protein [Verrucomicrobiae bacterium]
MIPPSPTRKSAKDSRHPRAQNRRCHLSRYDARRALADGLIDREDTARSIRAFLAIQNAEPIPFDQAGLALVQERAFDLVSAPKITASILATLHRVFHYNTARADYERRHAQSEKRLLQTDRRNEIAERAVKVREEELADRRTLRASPTILILISLPIRNPCPYGE